VLHESPKEVSIYGTVDPCTLLARKITSTTMHLGDRQTRRPRMSHERERVVSSDDLCSTSPQKKSALMGSSILAPCWLGKPLRRRCASESVEHEGPVCLVSLHQRVRQNHPYSGIYDTYLSCLCVLLSLLPRYGLTAFVALHQDVWSR